VRLPRRRLGWLRIAALVVAVTGFVVVVFVYGPGTATTRGIDPIEYHTPAFYYRLWTVVATVLSSVALLVVDTLHRVGDE
jgi:hypothetical protein